MSAAEMTNAEKIAKLKADKAEREKARAEAREAAQIEGLELEAQRDELEAKYEKELGRKGVGFDIVDATEYGGGFIVLKLGSPIAFQAYCDEVATAEGALPAAVLYDFVSPSVVEPAIERYREIVKARHGIAIEASRKLMGLHGISQKKVEGKY